MALPASRRGVHPDMVDEDGFIKFPPGPSEERLLPEFDPETDEGKVPTVSEFGNVEWTKPEGVPQHTVGDAGKVLTVGDDGELIWSEAGGGEWEVVDTSNFSSRELYLDSTGRLRAASPDSRPTIYGQVEDGYVYHVIVSSADSYPISVGLCQTVSSGVYVNALGYVLSGSRILDISNNSGHQQYLVISLSTDDDGVVLSKNDVRVYRKELNIT